MKKLLMFLVLAMLIGQNAARAAVTVSSVTRTGTSAAYLVLNISGVDLDSSTCPTDTYTLTSLKTYLTTKDSRNVWKTISVTPSGGGGTYTCSIPATNYVAGRTVTFYQVRVLGTYSRASDGVSSQDFLFDSAPALSYTISSTGYFNYNYLNLTTSGSIR